MVNPIYKNGDMVTGNSRSDKKYSKTTSKALMKIIDADSHDGQADWFVDVKIIDHSIKRYIGVTVNSINVMYLKHSKSAKGKKKQIVKYKPGENITQYIAKVLRVEKDKERLKWLRTFENCVLPDKVKATIEEALTIVLNSDVFEKWGINDHFEKGLTNSILIYGESGTGKTMVSESIASVLDKNLMKITTADIQSSMPGQAEKNITKAFKQAKDENAVLLFDECDSLLYNRDAVGMILGSEINHLLMEIERFDGVVIMTTNRLHKLDSALQRRIIARLYLGPPTLSARKQIWRKLVPPKVPIAKGVDYDKLAKAELTGGEIKNAILLAIRKTVARNEKKVTANHFAEAVVSVLKAKEDYADAQPQRIAESGPGLDKVRAT